MDTLKKYQFLPGWSGCSNLNGTANDYLATYVSRLRTGWTNGLVFVMVRIPTKREEPIRRVVMAPRWDKWLGWSCVAVDATKEPYASLLSDTLRRIVDADPAMERNEIRATPGSLMVYSMPINLCVPRADQELEQW